MKLSHGRSQLFGGVDSIYSQLLSSIELLFRIFFRKKCMKRINKLDKTNDFSFRIMNVREC